MMASPDLKSAFDAFNRRKDALQIWNSLDESVRKQLGGSELIDAYPLLRSVLDKAIINGCNSVREIMQFLFANLPRTS